MRGISFALLLVLLILTATGIVTTILARWERGVLLDLEENMLASGRAIAEFSSQGLDQEKLPPLLRLIQATQNATGSRIRVLDSEGKLLLDSLGLAADQQQGLRFRVEVRQALAGRWAGYTRLSDENPLSLSLFVAVPIPGDEHILGIAYVSHTTDEILQKLGDFRRALQRLMAILTLATFLTALYFSGRLRFNLKRLRKMAGQMGEEDDDVEAIGRGIDQLVASLQEQVAQLEAEKLKTRYFLEDVAHELKTPITGLSGSIEALLGDGDPERQRRLLNNVERETARLSELVSRLVDLQNLDYYELRLQKFEVRSLLETALDSFLHEAERKAINLNIEGPEQGFAYGDPDKLLTVIHNLLDNAIRCSPTQSSVILSFEDQGKELQIQIQDEGPGFEHSLLARRNRCGQASNLGSSGLGLAIAQQIVALHGGVLQVVPGPSGGSILHFSLGNTVTESTQN